MPNSTVKTAVFPVGGLGTRFLPATKSIPKEMLPVVDKPLIQYAFEMAKDAGIERFIFVTGRNKNVLSNHFDHVYELQRVLDEKRKEELLHITRDWLPDPGNIAFVRQQQPLGLGHPIWCARHLVQNEPFVVMLADELLLGKPNFIKEMLDIHAEKGGNVIGVADVAREDTEKYGIIDPKNDDGNLVENAGMVEKPAPEAAPSTLSIIGHYVLSPDIFAHLENTDAGAGGEIQLTDALCDMCNTHPSHALRFSGKRFDCGSKTGFLEANITYALENPTSRPKVEAMLKKLTTDYGINL